MRRNRVDWGIDCDRNDIMSRTAKDASFIPLRVAVITLSDSRTAENDTSGDILA